VKLYIQRILLLQFHLLHEKDRERTVQALVDNIVAHQMHLTTGFMGTPYICPVLSDNGQHEIAARMFLSEDYPSWLYEVNMGATTIWERWDSIQPDGSFQADGMNSLNHYANGSIGHWMYTQIAGIQPLSPGYQHMRFAPKLTPSLWDVAAKLETPYGLASGHYTCRDGKFVYDVQVPPNTTAEILLPGEKEKHYVGSGKYHFERETDIDLTPRKFDRFTPVKDVITRETAREILSQDAPGTLESPILGVLWNMPLFKLSSVMPIGSEWVLDKVTAALNAQEEKQ